MTPTLPDRLRVRRRALVPAALVVSAATAIAIVGFGQPAGAATVVHGRYSSAWQYKGTHQVHVRGYAFDGADRQSPVKVTVYVDGAYKKTLRADDPSSDYDKWHHIHGKHAFEVTVPAPANAKSVSLVVHAAGKASQTARTDSSSVGQRNPAGARIVSVAKKYVGSRYQYGASGPHAFDCSGFSRFVYKKANVASLPHNSQSQRDVHSMHVVSRSNARPGDLVFYLSGNTAYHVAIYAGDGKQYSASTPSTGVVHDKISSRNVIFKSDWH